MSKTAAYLRNASSPHEGHVRNRILITRRVLCSMPQTEEAAAWFAAVYETIQQVPHGRVTTYGHIARLVGTPERPRQVGVALKHLPDSSAGHAFHNDNVPWQRVINAKGAITPRGRDGAARQARALEAEGVEVTRGSLGEYEVDLSSWGWFPDEVEVN